MSDNTPRNEIQKVAENPNGGRSTQQGVSGTWDPKGMCWTPHVKIDPNSNMGGTVFEKKNIG
jgi:hypothetical protein